MGPNLKQVPMSSVASELKAKKYRMTAIDVDMDTCNGASGHGLAVLLDLTKPLDDGRDGIYFAWNKFHFFQWITVTIPSNLSLAERKKRLRAKLAFSEGYRVAGEPGPDELAKRSEEHTSE